MLRTQSSCIERFTQQISSVFTEQSQADVKSSVKGRMREPSSERFVAKENEQLLKNVKPQEVLSCELEGTISPHLDADCENALITLRQCVNIP